ncbi:hypothetical protein AVEN_131868-1 [Araneus ventricosus]|uniref:Uncharacterized protein n=1 Tax=Araneus ventricosus TaxID=182803 RepID=A0A4Y2NWS5_ARAVE|nr:hypothetical protein AVEN_131868-1 [Araneus ventricosus]
MWTSFVISSHPHLTITCAWLNETRPLEIFTQIKFQMCPEKGSAPYVEALQWELTFAFRKTKASGTRGVPRNHIQSRVIQTYLCSFNGEVATHFDHIAPRKCSFIREKTRAIKSAPLFGLFIRNHSDPSSDRTMECAPPCLLCYS